MRRACAAGITLGLQAEARWIPSLTAAPAGCLPQELAAANEQIQANAAMAADGTGATDHSAQLQVRSWPAAHHHGSGLPARSAAGAPPSSRCSKRTALRRGDEHQWHELSRLVV